MRRFGRLSTGEPIEALIILFCFRNFRIELKLDEPHFAFPGIFEQARTTPVYKPSEIAGREGLVMAFPGC